MKILLPFIISFSFYGCATNFTPLTMEGAECKKECSISAGGCQGSSYSCDRTLNTCIDSCRDLDRISASEKK